MNGNGNLTAARKAKRDEFYTRYEDVEREMDAYLEYDRNLFLSKTVLLPCDDPDRSNFTRYFTDNFDRFGLKKLISTSIAVGDADGHGKISMLTQDMSGDAISSRLDGDGDFRSPEVTRLRDQSDFIITNPPFSLFREFLAWTLESGKKFAIIGNQNVITYKDVFPYLKENKIWLGNGFSGNVGFFASPYEDTAASPDHHEGFIRVPGVMWFTNIDLRKRHRPLPLSTMAHNLEHNEKLRRKLRNDYGRLEYPRYDHYDAIEVPFVDAIPSDYGGVMAVPITFMDKHNPEQFEILEGASRYGILDTWGRNDAIHASHSHGNSINGKTTYFRLHIRNLRPEPHESP